MSRKYIDLLPDEGLSVKTSGLIIFGILVIAVIAYISISWNNPCSWLFREDGKNWDRLTDLGPLLIGIGTTLIAIFTFQAARKHERRSFAPHILLIRTRPAPGEENNHGIHIRNTGRGHAINVSYKIKIKNHRGELEIIKPDQIQPNDIALLLLNDTKRQIGTFFPSTIGPNSTERIIWLYRLDELGEPPAGDGPKNLHGDYKTVIKDLQSKLEDGVRITVDYESAYGEVWSYSYPSRERKYKKAKTHKSWTILEKANPAN